eukprot:m.411750 g.411750  ORF g.411750 m.411750 type:complete len:375 (-) comp28727_c0_seq1:108-1232(-)
MPTSVTTTVTTTVHPDGTVDQSTETNTIAAGAAAAPSRILGMGNPLLDISAVVTPEYLAKYKLEKNNQILAEESHMPIYAEMVKDYEVEYIAGGATQNSIRVAQWMLGAPCTAYIGSVGKDAFGKTLREKAEEGGTTVEYMVDPEAPTGTCAVLVTGINRSLVANISAANNYKETHLAEVGWKHVEAAEIFYISGFFLTVSPPSILKVGKHAAETNKIFSMNLGAPFIMMVPPFREAFLASLPYCDYLFGNETEYAEFAKQTEMGTEDLEEIAKKIQAMPKANGKRSRVVVITQGAKPTIVCQDGKISIHSIIELPKEKLVDTNGAGDAWVGGFLAALAKKGDVEACTKAGSFAASVIIQRSGCTHPKACDYKL